MRSDGATAFPLDIDRNSCQLCIANGAVSVKHNERSCGHRGINHLAYKVGIGQYGVECYRAKMKLGIGREGVPPPK